LRGFAKFGGSPSLSLPTDRVQALPAARDLVARSLHYHAPGPHAGTEAREIHWR